MKYPYDIMRGTSILGHFLSKFAAYKTPSIGVECESIG